MPTGQVRGQPAARPRLADTRTESGLGLLRPTTRTGAVPCRISLGALSRAVGLKAAVVGALGSHQSMDIVALGDTPCSEAEGAARTAG